MAPSSRHHRPIEAPPGGSSSRSTKVSLSVCRGCCCGTTRKHPDVDHDAQIALLAAVCRVRRVDCVDECARSNVVIVKRPHGPTVWFGGVLTVDSTAQLCAWIELGAPDDVPDDLASHVFRRRDVSTDVSTDVSIGRRP